MGQSAAGVEGKLVSGTPESATVAEVFYSETLSLTFGVCITS